MNENKKIEDKIQQGKDMLSVFRLRMLKILDRVLLFFLWLVPLYLILFINRIIHYDILHSFLTCVRQPSTIFAWVSYCISCVGMMLSMGVLCATSGRLRIAKRIIIWMMIWVPFVNYGLAWYVHFCVKEEIDHNENKISLDDVRVEHQICKTRYPFLLVHGVGFRDYKYFNYWGRIPRELARNGAKIYYGNQEAWATIENNAVILKEQIEHILQKENCEKINIIAHSKGGLDCRYLISQLHMAPFVASLTTINTPHRGSKLVEFLKHLPPALYKMVCHKIDQYFTAFGDTQADAFTSSNQLSCAWANQFNIQCVNDDCVFYQSYTSIMKHGISSKLLCIPYWILKKMDGPNDGLVTPESAKWGEFRGVIANRHIRGISHGDMIDLTREDYKDFNVLEFYVQVVQELAQKGF